MGDEITPKEIEQYDREQEDTFKEVEDEALGHAEYPSVEVWETLRSGTGFDLRDVDTTLPTEWVPGAEGIVRPRERALWNAKQGEGKTQAALHLAAQVTAAGGRVMYLDVENDRVEMAARMQPIMDSFGDWGRLSYLPDLNLAAVHANDELMKVWAQSLIATNVLIIDSFTRVLRACSKDEDSNTDVADWMGEYVDPIAKAGGGVAVVILDNTGHEGTRSRGAINKEALVETVYKVSGGKGVKPDRTGTLELKLMRSRSGRVADYVRATSGGGSSTPLEAQHGSAPKGGSAQAIMEERRASVAVLLRSHPDKTFDVNAVMATTGTSRNTVKGDMAALVASDLAEPDGGGWKSGPAGRQSTTHS
jgi:hypothetical protein